MMGIRFGMGLPGPFYYSTSVGGRRRRDDRPLGPDEQKVGLWLIGLLWLWWIINYWSPLVWWQDIGVALVIYVLVTWVIKRFKRR